MCSSELDHPPLAPSHAHRPTLQAGLPAAEASARLAQSVGSGFAGLGEWVSGEAAADLFLQVSFFGGTWNLTKKRICHDFMIVY